MRSGVTHNPGDAAGLTRGLPTDTEHVRALLGDPTFRATVRAVAHREGLDDRQALRDAAGFLREMSAVHTGLAATAWDRFGRWMTRAYEVAIDEEALAHVRELDQNHPLVFLPSHRSYLDAWAAMNLSSRGVRRCFLLGGANMNFFPFGLLARHVGLIFIRRTTAGQPVYRLALRSFIAELVARRENVSWAIEGGRTRTGKLRPPRYGLLRYLVEAVDSAEGPEVLLVPQSVVYDQLHEVAAMASEARGGVKRPETGIWLARYARSQHEAMGRAYVDFGEPIPLRARLTELRAEGGAEDHLVERVALDVTGVPQLS
jgi:glycerol-3-phosphate O-acyltransferase